MNKNKTIKTISFFTALLINISFVGYAQAESMLINANSVNNMPERGFNLNMFYVGDKTNNMAQIKGVGGSGCIYFGEYYFNDKTHYVKIDKEVCGGYSVSVADMYALPKEKLSSILIDGSYIDSGELYLFTNKKPNVINNGDFWWVYMKEC